MDSSIRPPHKLDCELIKTDIIHQIVESDGIKHATCRVANHLSKLAFPTKAFFGYHPHVIMRNLRRYAGSSTSQIECGDTVAPIRLYKPISDIISMQWDSQFVTIKCTGLYYTHNCISEYFQELVRVSHAKRKKNDHYPIEYWTNVDLAATWIRPLIKSQSEFTFHNVRRYIDMAVRKQCDHFSPTVIIDILRMLGFGVAVPGSQPRILDLCAGWGDRAAACIAMNYLYVGIDPNTLLQPGYDRMSRTFKGSSIQIIYEPAESVTLESLGVRSDDNNTKFDMVWAFPPYFDAEEYCDQETQSRFYGSVERWVTQFLIPCIRLGWESLRDDGYFILNINDVFDRGTRTIAHYTEFINLWVGANMPCRYIGMVTYRTSENSPLQPVFIWRRRSAMDPAFSTSCANAISSVYPQYDF